MIRKKRATVLLLIMCMLLCLCACGGQTGSQETESSKETNTEKTSTEQSKESDISESATTTEAPVEETPASTPDPKSVEPISLQKQFCGLYDWEDDFLLVRSEYSHVTMCQDDAAENPALAQILEQKATMIRQSMEEEYDNFGVFAREEPEATEEGMEAWVSTLDVQVRRADSIVVSLLSDSYSDYGWIDGYRGMHGTNYDTQTGQELTVNDVVKEINQELTDAVSEELNSHMWAGDFDYTQAVEEYFANTPYDGISWTLDYNGVTFYFAEGTLTEPGNGCQTATVDFARHPELFEEKYMDVPDAYMVELPMDSSFFTDLDGDGDLEELNVTSVYSSDVGMYNQFGIYTDTQGHYYYEDCFADSFLPYYVKTASGEHYVYLFCRENEGAFPRFTLKVFDVYGGNLTFIDEMRVGPGFIDTDFYRVPTDPMHLYLGDFDTMGQDMMPFAVGKTGMPEPK